MEHTTTKDTVSQMVSSTMITVIELLKKLLKIVVENKVRNAEPKVKKIFY